MLATNNILNFTTDRSHQQHHIQQHQHLSTYKRSSTLTNALPPYDLFNSLSLFPMETPSNQGLIHDFSSSTSTQSPKEEFLDDFNFKLRDNVEIMSNDNVMFQLKEALETIHILNQKISILGEDVQQKQHTIANLQSALALKDIKIQKMMAHSKGQIDMPSLSTNDSADFKFQDKAPLLDNNPSSYSDNANKWSLWAADEVNKKTENKHTDYDSMVLKLLKNNDQHLSVFLQQKLKICSLEQKQAIFDAIYRESYSLMTNRFGNFLVQRIFDFGTPEQIKNLTQTMKGRVLQLTCDRFGCHVVQKALDSVDEKTKSILVSELFQDIPTTIRHKSACHVWQKVFEIRWVHYDVNVMGHLDEALKGNWTQVALDEIGSLVIQNMFENLRESDKRPVLNEVLDNKLTIARGQWGNWVIQHIMEQSDSIDDRQMLFDMVLQGGIQFCMDQFASKVVEKALSIGGDSYLDKFIHHISTTTRTDRPRIALIDIAGDQYGNYVIQWIINRAPVQHKINVCRLIKKHMVTIRGTKYGQRVASMVDKYLKQNQENPVYPPTS